MRGAATSSSASRRSTDWCSRRRSYYRSSYAFVSRRDRHLRIDSFDAPSLKRLTIGIQISGDDYNNPPAAQALAVAAHRCRTCADSRSTATTRVRIRSARSSMPSPTDASTSRSSGARWPAITRSASPRRIDVRPIAGASNDARRGSRSTSPWVSVATIRRCAPRSTRSSRGAETTMRQILRAYGVPLR